MTRRSFPFIPKQGMMDCGAACLAMVFRHYGYHNIQSLLSRLGGLGTEGMSLYSLAELASGFGFAAEAFELGWEHIHELKLPLIAHYGGTHFIVVYRISETHVWIADPAYGKDRLPRAEFLHNWNGIALELSPTAALFAGKDLEEAVAAFLDDRRSLYRRFYRPVIRALRPVLLEVLLATAFLQLLGLAVPFFTQTIVDNALVGQNRRLLLSILAGMSLVFFAQIFLLYVRNLLLVQLRVNFELDFFSRFFRHFISLKQQFYDANKREDFMARFQEHLNIRQLVNPAVVENIVDLAFVLLYVPVLFALNLKLGLLVLAFVIAYTAVTAVYTPALRRLAAKVFQRNMETLGSFLDVLLGMQSVKLLGIEPFKIAQWRSRYKRSLHIVLESERKGVLAHSVQRSLFHLGQLAVFWMGGYMCFNGEISVGQYLAVSSIFLMVLHALLNLSGIWNNLTELWIGIARINEVLLQEPERRDPLQAPEPPDTGTVTIRGLSFRYRPDDAQDVLRNVNLSFRRGEHIGIVGRNGSGKTTLVKLLLGLYPDYEGEIRYGAAELREVHPAALRKCVFLFPQEVYVFSGTMAENIRYGRPDADLGAVIHAAKLAGLHDHIRSLHLGYNTSIGDSGTALSGGQRLKLGFARLFLADPDIIILDEASSLLDPGSEQEIFRNLRCHFAGRTIISIAHRMNTLRDADRIWVIDDGRVAEDGGHDELLRSGGIYHQFMKTYVEL